MYDQTSGEPVGNVKKYLADGVTLSQCSGGQKQIVYALRMLASKPQILICDEALSSLDQYVKVLPRRFARSKCCECFTGTIPGIH